MKNKHEDKRQALLKAALSLFTKHGFDGTPTSKIAKEAGVATGFLFFKSLSDRRPRSEVIKVLLSERGPVLFFSVTALRFLEIDTPYLPICVFFSNLF